MKNVKTSGEIILIEEACEVTDKALEFILQKIKPGVTEKEIASEIARFIRKNNASLSFRPIVAFGKNSAEPHHKSNNTKLKKKDIVLLDLGAKLNGYCSDMTRTVFMSKPTNEQKRIYQTVLTAQQKAIEFLKCHSEHIQHTQCEESQILRQVPSGTWLRYAQDDNGIKAVDVDKAARDHIISQNYPNIPHGLGHGIGKKVHEAPRLSPNSRRKLLASMVFSVEPGIYIENFGGVRIEDLVVLEKTGPRVITHFTKEIIEL